MGGVLPSKPDHLDSGFRSGVVARNQTGTSLVQCQSGALRISFSGWLHCLPEAVNEQEKAVVQRRILTALSLEQANPDTLWARMAPHMEQAVAEGDGAFLQAAAVVNHRIRGLTAMRELLEKGVVQNA